MKFIEKIKTWRQSKLAFAAILAGLFMAGCEDSDDEMTMTDDNPEVDVTAKIRGESGNLPQTGGSVTAGDTVDFTYEVTAPGGFNTLHVLNNDGSSIGGPINRETPNINITDGGQTAKGTFFIKTPALPDETSYSIKFVAVDSDNVKSDTFKITATVSPPGVQTFEMVLLGAQGNAAASFYDAKENEKHTFQQASAGTTSGSIDFAYYWGNTNNHTLASIDDDGLEAVFNTQSIDIATFGTRHSTLLTEVTSNTDAAAFDGIENNEQLASAAMFETGGASDATMLAADDVVAFKFDPERVGMEEGAKRFGLIKIVSINLGTGGGLGDMTIEVKIAGE